MNLTEQPNQPPIRAVCMGLFPTMDSLEEVLALAKSMYPQDNGNPIVGLLMTYHNSLLKALKDEKKKKS